MPNANANTAILLAKLYCCKRKRSINRLGINDAFYKATVGVLLVAYLVYVLT